MVFGPDDLVIRKSDNGKYSAGGFNISNIIQSNPSPCVTLATHNEQTGGSNVAILDGLKNLAVPAGLLYLQQSLSRNYLKSDKDETISENLYNKLFNLASLSDEHHDKPKNSQRQITRKKGKFLKDNKKTMTKIIQNLIINFKLWPHQLSWLSSRQESPHTMLRYPPCSPLFCLSDRRIQRAYPLSGGNSRIERLPIFL